jgi:putative hydrolase of the HAD superfamily
MKPPKVIFLDAVGTLFGVQGTVGEIYSAIAARMGVMSSPEALDQAFYQSFKAASPLAFAEVDPMVIPDLEYQWWKAIAYDTFTQVKLIEQFTDFERFFTELYAHFATAKPWFLYNDVFPILNHWQQQGIELGIISNFDSRIYQVLDHLGLSQFFSSITISSLTGAAKPNSKIFQTALEIYHCDPRQAWHIGDSFKEDYEGAKSIGIKAFLIDRNSSQKEFDVISTMTELMI